MPRLASLTAQIRAAYGAGLLSVMLLPLAVQAAPVDPVVRVGTATFAINGNVYTVTNAPNTIIDWRQFNVANGELLRFLQQNPQSVVLNRVTGADPSQLFGMLQSNGKVVLVNPNGILFGPNAQLDVAGLIASTLNLSDADFLAGRMAFSGGGGLLQNQGRITTPLGGSVYLIGGDVTNNGVIAAPGGRILLAAGQSVQLADSGTPGLSVTLKADGNRALNLGELNAAGGSIDIYGALVNHSGIARADSATADAHGNIVLKASDAATVSGTVSAVNTGGGGGMVQVLGDSVALSGTAHIDASGATGGGTVLAGGDYKGGNAAVPNARTASVAAGARIDASATDHGDGGKVVVWSNEKTDYAGSIVAQGGANGGNGGLVETSGKLLSFDQGRVNTLAPKGKTGSWLLDPAVFCFYVSSASECTGAAAAGATSFNALGNILVSSGGILDATDFVTFLPSGGNASVGNAIPDGLTLVVRAPYIQLGNGANVDTKNVGIRLEASKDFGNTTQTFNGASLTGSIDIGGHLGSTADQTLESTGGNISLRHGGSGYTALHMFSSSGTQRISTTGQLLIEAGQGNDASGNPRVSALYSDGTQIIAADKLTLIGGNTAGAANTSADIGATGNQTITAKDITLTAGVSGRSNISVNAKGMSQTINAGTIVLTGGSGGVNNDANLSSQGNQSISADSMVMKAGSSGTNNLANVRAFDSTNAVQSINVKALTLEGGAGGVNNYAAVHMEGANPTQTLTATSVTMKGGSGDSGNWARMWMNDSNGANKSRQSITTKSLALTGGTGAVVANAEISGNASQTITAETVSLTGGSGGNTGGNANIYADGDQTITATGSVTLQGGTGTDSANAYLSTSHNQTISTGLLAITGGASGNNNSANVSTYGGTDATQRINAGKIVMTGGAGGSNNFSGLHAGSLRAIQIINSGDITMTGGAGSGNWAHLNVTDTGKVSAARLEIVAGALTQTGGSALNTDAGIGGNGSLALRATSITLQGGSGDGASANIGAAGDAVHTVTGAISITGGTSGGTGAGAGMDADGALAITAAKVSTQAGASGSNNNAGFSAGKDLTLSVAGAVAFQAGTGIENNVTGLSAGAAVVLDADSFVMRGGATGRNNAGYLNSAGAMTIKTRNGFTLAAGSGTGNSTNLNSGGNQTIEAATVSLTAGSAGADNHANISMRGGADAVQKVTAGTFSMLGGQGGSNNIAGLHANGTRVVQEVNASTLSITGGKGAGNWAHIASGYQDPTPSIQRINAGAMTVTGGGGVAADMGNDAAVLASGTQVIKGNTLMLAGGAAGTNSSASVSNNAETGSQSMELTGAFSLAAGAADGAGASVYANSTQSIKADSIGITAGAAGNGSSAGVFSNGSRGQEQTVSTNKLSIMGGAGGGNQAMLFQVSGGLQKVVITGGGSIAIQAGNGGTFQPGPSQGYCSGCSATNNTASIWAMNKSSQLIDFVSGGTLALKGGTGGAANAASIAVAAVPDVKQTITSSGGAANYPVISLTGGGGGFYNPGDGAEAGNGAAIGAFDSFTPVSGLLKTINAKSVTLTAGSANARGNAVLAVGAGDAVVNITGDVTMTGGASNMPLLMATDPAKSYGRDFGSSAAISTFGSLDLTVGGNLTIRGGSGSSGTAGVGTTGTIGRLNVKVGGATRMVDGNSMASIASRITMSEVLPGPGSTVIDIGADDRFTTSTLAASGKNVGIGGVINVTGSSSNAMLVGAYGGAGELQASGWQAVGSKPLQAEIYASEKFSSEDATINTPNGSWIVTLGKNAAAALGANTGNAVSYGTLSAHGYQWTTAAYNSSNAQDFRFILPDNSPVVEIHADETIAQSSCSANPALCVTQPIVAMAATSAVAPVVVDVNLTGGVDTTPLSASLAQAKAEAPAPETAPAPKVQGPRVAVREKEQARAENEKKSTADLKREARDSSAVAKVSQEAARKAAALAQKEAAEARRIAAAAAKTEALAAKAATAVTAAEGDLRAAQADARDARTALAAATTPAQKNQANLRLATAEAARANAEAKLADTRARRAELGAQGSEAGARRAQAESVVYDAGAREAAAEAKIAGAAHAEALVRAREAKDTASRAAAQRLADDKRIEATQRAAESDVRQSLADDLRFASEQGKAQADARQAQAQAAQALAQARRDEVRLQRALARTRQEDVSGKGASARSAQGGKEVADKLVAAESKRAEASQAAANAKAEAAEARQRKADEGMAEVARRDGARRERAMKAFVAGATASMTASQLASQAALRHEYKGLLFKDALKVLEQNGRAADLPACGGNISNTCMPSFAQARMEWPTARPLVRKPVAAYLPQIERKVAIVIGINAYADQAIPQLETAVPDAKAVAAQLEAAMGYETRVLQNPTKAEIVAALQGVARELDPNDSLVVYYAGHGYMRAVPKGPAQGYWIPADGKAASPANWISNTDVSKLLANIPAKQVMLVSDSCYSGAFSKEQKVSAAGDPSSILARRSVTVMSSGGEEPVSDDGVDGHSIFAWSLMQSMKKVGQVEAGNRVFDTTREQVTAAYPQVPQYGAAVSAGHAQGGDYLFETRTYK